MKTACRFGFLGQALLSICYGQAVITTVAGNGSIMYFGDGGPATEAGLDLAFEVAVDAAGSL
jgi:hypothetical protein